MGTVQADSVEITILVENWVDMLLPDLSSATAGTASGPA